jgi:HAD superfamily hydrolase (TIGR01450 family)
MTLQGSLDPLAARYDVALLDLDGVVYVGAQAVPGAPAAVLAAAELGMRGAYVTNNASRTPEEVAAHLRHLGLPASAEHVVTSAMAGARLLRELVPERSRIFMLGGLGLRQALDERGFRVVRSAEEGPAAVVQGWAPDLDWPRLAEAAYALALDIPWVATNTDPTLPTPRGRAPGNGSVVALLERATGRRPLVAGKPEPPMHREAMARTGARRPLVVGDRLDTDIAGAENAEVPSLLVLSGVTDPVDLVLAPPGMRPTYLADDLAGLLRPHPEPIPDGEGWRCGDAVAVADRDGLRLHRVGDRLDTVRAVCMAVWHLPGTLPRGDVRDVLAPVLP